MPRRRESILRKLALARLKRCDYSYQTEAIKQKLSNRNYQTEAIKQPSNFQRIRGLFSG